MSMKYIILTNVISSIMLKHPISMGSMLMLQTTLLCVNQSIMSKSPWYMYILFLTTVGGLMVMFMYMASIASNEIFKPSYKLIMLWMMIMLMTSILMKYSDLSMDMMQKIKENKMCSTQMMEEKTTTKFFMMNKMNITMTMMTILALTMVSVTNISSTFEGPLKKTYV
nr:NADH dehydrogenase subunit 6 [Penthicodes variegata]